MQPLWDMAALSQPPRTYEAPGFSAPRVRSLFYEGLPWKGEPTRVFAYYGAPEKPPGEKVPAMVLVHGGGGTARDHWVRLWNRRGYAAIAMDTCGCTVGGEHYDRPRHELGGPPGCGGFGQVAAPLSDQWPYHAVADVILAHSLIRSFPEIDAERIGLTGISWGGVVTCITASVDTRWRCAVPVYGCGYLAENHTGTWARTFQKLGRGTCARWTALWDPSQFLPRVALPMLWVTGTNDVTFPLVNLQRSYRLPRAERTLCVKVRMPHNEEGERAPEIGAYVESFLDGGVPLARITGQGESEGTAWARYDAAAPVAQAAFNFTRATCNWREREWRTAPASVDSAQKKVFAHVPFRTTAYYFNLIDERGLIVSSEHVEPGA